MFIKESQVKTNKHHDICIVILRIMYAGTNLFL